MVVFELLMAEERIAKLEKENERLRSALANSVNAFTEAVLHGSEEHKQWLREAADDFVCGRPIRIERK